MNPSGSRKIKTLVSTLLDWFAASARDLPWRHTRDPYAIWVSEIMLQQTQVKTVIPYWERWMRELPTVAALARAKPEKVLKLWEGLGYYTRARNLQKTTHLIVTESGGHFPDQFDRVLALPGIGRYTAGAICSIAFNQPAPILDGNVIRVLTRLFGTREDPRQKLTNTHLWLLAEQLVTHASNVPPPATAKTSPSTTHSTGTCSQLNQSLMELGALLCTPRQPCCELCPVRKLCVARREDLVDQIPKLTQRPPATQRRVVAFVAEQRGRFLVQQRPAGIVNARLWEFPHQEVNGTDIELLPLAQRFFGATRISPQPLCVIKHSITRYRIHLEAFHAVLPAGAKSVDGQWLKPADLQQLAFASAHRKILHHLLARE